MPTEDCKIKKSYQTRPSVDQIPLKRLDECIDPVSWLPSGSRTLNAQHLRLVLYMLSVSPYLLNIPNHIYQSLPKEKTDMLGFTFSVSDIFLGHTICTPKGNFSIIVVPADTLKVHHF